MSFSTKWDISLLWSHYANNHEGFCVGLKEEWLRESEKFGTGGLVNYQINYPKIDPTDEDMMTNMFVETHTKSKEWEYEGEFRLTKIFYPSVPSKAERKVKYDKEALAEIYFGLNMSQIDKDQILSSLPTRDLKIFQIIKKPFQFSLDRVRVD